MKVTRIKRELLNRINAVLPLIPIGSQMKSFEISNPDKLLKLKTEGEDLLVYDFETANEFYEHKEYS